MFTVARDQARLLPSDLHHLLGVSRCTVSMWFNGHHEPTPSLRSKVNKLLDAIKAGVEAGDFPVPHGIKRRERGPYVIEHLAKHLQSTAES